MYQILIVEDDKALSNGIVLALKTDECCLIQCHTMSAAKAVLSQQVFDLLILDINLPDGNGLDLMREVKQSKKTPVILLTANDLETDVVFGLELGADDYITKPFSLAILRARVNTQLRKAHRTYTSYFEQGVFRFDFEQMTFFKDHTRIDLSKTEQRLLRLLVENKGNALERSTLVDQIWTDGAEYVDENALSVTIKRLRDKLEDTPSKPEYIKTVYGIGYLWAVK